MKARKGQDDRYQQKGQAFHRTLREAYLDLAKKYPARIKVIDASKDPDTTAKAVQAAMEALGV
jgi:dTMP kinase